MADSPYFPYLDQDWESIEPDAAGFDTDALAAALRFAESHESTWPRDLENAHFLPSLTADEPEPWNKIIGPMAPRGGPAGLLLKGGRLVAQWGDIDRADMTFSIAKSYLSILAGLAMSKGLIGSLDARVGDAVLPDLFQSPQNRQITWRHLLTQTSEWQGELFSKPDQVDHFRELGPDSTNSRKGQKRDLSAPGAYWEYNDVRVNLLSLSLLHLFKQPLPDVLRQEIMDPIGASDAWEWWGYENSEVEVDGKSMISVSGGSHWGGGMRISARDHARFGLLVQRGGAWRNKQILPEQWIYDLRQPIDLNPQYGFLWWLNTDRGQYPSAPASSFFAMGAGTNLIWIDQTLDITMVARWVDQAAVDPLLGAFMSALKG